tara:strand:- start:40 stop:924 length:885 start_codon:yes stop_codon:yes gene_type:complete
MFNNNIAIKTDTTISFDSLKQSIIHNLQIGTIAYLQVGLDLKSAFSNDKIDYTKLLKEVCMSERTGEKMRKIATDENINSVNRNLLPTSWTTTHYLTQLDDDQFEIVKPHIAPLRTKGFYMKKLGEKNDENPFWGFLNVKVKKQITLNEFLELKDKVSKVLETNQDILDVELTDLEKKIDKRDNPKTKKQKFHYVKIGGSKVKIPTYVSKQTLKKQMDEKKLINRLLNKHYGLNRDEEQNIGALEVNEFFKIPSIKETYNTVFSDSEESNDDTMDGVTSKEFSDFKEDRTQEVA